MFGSQCLNPRNVLKLLATWPQMGHCLGPCDSMEIHLLKTAATVTEHCHSQGKCGASTEVPLASVSPQPQEEQGAHVPDWDSASGPAQADEYCCGLAGTQLLLPI